MEVMPTSPPAMPTELPLYLEVSQPCWAAWGWGRGAETEGHTLVLPRRVARLKKQRRAKRETEQ